MADYENLLNNGLVSSPNSSKTQVAAPPSLDGSGLPNKQVSQHSSANVELPAASKQVKPTEENTKRRQSQSTMDTPP